METKKIAIACFIGGALCCAVALMCSPVYWWFGMLAGFAGGYISYEFREVLRAVPVALRAAGRGSVWAWEEAVDRTREYLSERHPFIYSATVITTPLFVWGMYVFPLMTTKDGSTMSVLWKIFVVFVGAIAFAEIVMVTVSIMAIFAFIGARVGERAYWWPPLMHTDSDRPQELEAKSLQLQPLTYANVWRWISKGIGFTILFFVWTLWKHIAIGAWKTLCFLGRFAWHLFKLIHSHKRVLCTIDGTLGGAVSYIWFASAPMSFGSHVALVIFGGLLGAAFGVANWGIVSKRVLRVAE